MYGDGSVVVSPATGLLLVVGFLTAAVGSVPLAVVAVALARRRPFSAGLVRALAATGVLVAVLAGAVATVTPAAGVAVAVVGAVLGAVLWVVPLAVARWFLVRRGVGSERALRSATLGLPVSMAVAVAIAFGGFGRYNITFSTGLEAVLRWTALVAVVLFGPTVVGAVADATTGPSE